MSTQLEDTAVMDMLRLSSNKVVDTLAHAQSSTNMAKSVSGASLASSQMTQRTKCSSGFSSIAGSVRGAMQSSAVHTPGGAPRGSSSMLESFAETSPPAGSIPPVARGGGNTVLGGVAPTFAGMLKRRGRFSGWKADSAYFELRSTALLGFSSTGCSGGSKGGHGSGHGSGSLASLAARIMHSPHNKQAGDWSWSTELAGAERVMEHPSLTKRDAYAFSVEFSPGSKRKTLVLAAPSASAREQWMRAMDGARQCVRPKDFHPISVIGEGHFGKVLLVRWKNGARRAPPATRAITVPPRLAEEGDEEAEEQEVKNSANGGSERGSATDREYDSDRFLAVKEVALHKGSCLPGVLNERQILGVLTEHPFVVTLRCAWRRGNFLYYGLDFLPGADLFELFRRNAIKMDLQSATCYGGQVALALEHLHAHGICYRDLKPENILVDANGHLRLADMGLSKILGNGKEALRTSTVCGTRAYLAPEMILRKPYGVSVDFWQFGCFIFELYAGHSPFWMPRSGPPGRSNDQTVALILAGEIHYPRSIEPVAKAFVRDLLHPDIDSRLGCRVAPQSGAPHNQSSSSLASGDPADVAASAAPKEGFASGWQSVRQHGFFKGMDWEALLRGEIPAPIKPSGSGRGMVGNFAREYTRQRAGWGGDQQELRDVADKEGLFKRELMGFDFVRD